MRRDVFDDLLTTANAGKLDRHPLALTGRKMADNNQITSNALVQMANLRASIP